MNSLVNMKKFEEWGQNYKQHMTESASNEAFDVTNMSRRDPDRDRGAKGKPMRLRRRSRKSPTTLLNANPNNFRSLVQKFTGCNTCNLVSAGAYKGPINLNFANYNINNEKPGISHHHKEEERIIVHEKSDQSFFSSGTNCITDHSAAAAAATMVDSSNSIPDQFILEDEFDMALQEISQGGNYSDFPETSNNHEFWGY